eukprot:145972_1
MDANISILHILLFILTSIANGTKLDSLYYVNTTLFVNEGPYEVESDVIISQDATLKIENGVEIIFEGDSSIIVRGSIIVGCNDIDTFSNNHRGLINNTLYTYIHGTNNNGYFTFEYDTYGEFCNVLFDEMSSAFLFEGFKTAKLLLIDNCLFKSPVQLRGNTKITDSEFTYGSGISLTEHNHACTTTFDNCLFTNFGTIYIDWITVYISNSDIMNNNDADCISTTDYSSAIIDNSTISNCLTGINTQYSRIISSEIKNCSIGILNGHKVHIEFTNIRNNNIGLKLSSRSYGTNIINYNNFIDNTINIESDAEYDQINITLNYFGSNTTNQSIIASTIKDICDGYSNGLVTFWPWLIKPFINKYNIDQEVYTFDFKGCHSIHVAKSYALQMHTKPTSAPTSITKTNFPSIISTASSTTDSNVYLKDNSSSQSSSMVNLIPIFLAILLFIACSYMYFKIQKSNKEKEKKHMEMEMEGLIEPQTANINIDDTKGNEEDQKLIAV